jgi:hypothetical protein
VAFFYLKLFYLNTFVFEIGDPKTMKDVHSDVGGSGGKGEGEGEGEGNGEGGGRETDQVPSYLFDNGVRVYCLMADCDNGEGMDTESCFGVFSTYDIALSEMQRLPKEFSMYVREFVLQDADSIKTLGLGCLDCDSHVSTRRVWLITEVSDELYGSYSTYVNGVSGAPTPTAPDGFRYEYGLDIQASVKDDLLVDHWFVELYRKIRWLEKPGCAEMKREIDAKMSEVNRLSALFKEIYGRHHYEL